MRTHRALFVSLMIGLVFSGCDDENSNPVLPSGCAASSRYAIEVLESRLACRATNAFTDAENALGSPDAAATGDGKTQYRGFVSLGIGGDVVLYLGSCIADAPGPDFRVYQSVSREAVEVQVARQVEGPYISLGAQDCVDPPPFFQGFCDFDLASSGLSNIRIVKVIDREVITFPDAACDNAGLSPGADLDAVEVLHSTE